MAHAGVVVVLNSRDATVSLLDQNTHQEISSFSVGKEPHHLMATPDNKSVIVASAVGNELIFLDPRSGQVQRRVPDIIDPYQIGFSPDNKWFVSNALRLDRVDLYAYDGRDLKPTADLRAVLKGLLADQFGLSAAVLADTVFPDSGHVKPMQGLIG